MQPLSETSEDGGGPWKRYGLMAGTAVVVGVLFFIGVMAMLSGDKEPTRKVQDLTIVAIVPPPPPPPPPPPKEEVPPEPKVVEQTPIKQEIQEEKPVDIPKEAPPDANNDPMPGPPGLDDEGKGPGELLGKPGGRGFIGGGTGPGGGGSRWGWYASIVQSQIESALRANEKTRYAALQIQVRLWSDGTGRVNRVQLVSSSGNPELDSIIRDQVLSGLTLREPPPKDMPMPIGMRVTMRKPG